MVRRVERQQGMSLVEILVALALVAIISSSAYFGLNQFNRYQNLRTSYENLKNTVSEAKTNAQSQVSRRCTRIQTLVGHQIRINSVTNPDSYNLEEVCLNLNSTESTYVIKTLNVTSDITLSGASGPILFLVLTGNVRNPGSITLTNNIQSKSITVNSTGIIQ